MNESLAQLRTYRLGSGELRRGKPNQSDNKMDGFFVGIGFALLGFIGGAVGWLICIQQWHGVWTAGVCGVLIAFSGYSLFPVFSWVWSLLRYQKWPDIQFFDQFSVGQKYVCVVMLSWGLVYGGNHLYPYLVGVEQKNPLPIILTTYQNANKGHRRHDQHVASPG